VHYRPKPPSLQGALDRSLTNMKKHLKQFACLAAVLVPLIALAKGYDKDYCGGNEYVGNPSNKYPHLHCKKDVFTFSTSASKHDNMHEGQGARGAGCKRAAKILEDKPYNSENSTDPGAITTAIEGFVRDYCSR